MSEALGTWRGFETPLRHAGDWSIGVTTSDYFLYDGRYVASIITTHFMKKDMTSVECGETVVLYNPDFKHYSSMVSKTEGDLRLQIERIAVKIIAGTK